MMQPFYMAYEMKFGGMEKVADIVRQFKNVRRYLWHAEKGLNYHAYDESKQMFWADKDSGCLANFWLRYQAEDGLVYQVIEHPEAEGNYTETSGSAMIAFALMKGVRMGILNPEKYLPIIVALKFQPEADGAHHLTAICWVAGLGPEKNPNRDGSVAYYLSEPKKTDDSKGVGTFIMAYSEYLMARKERNL